MKYKTWVVQMEEKEVEVEPLNANDTDLEVKKEKNPSPADTEGADLGNEEADLERDVADPGTDVIEGLIAAIEIEDVETVKTGGFQEAVNHAEGIKLGLDRAQDRLKTPKVNQMITLTYLSIQ